MQYLLALLSQVTHQGITVGRAVVKIGRASFEIVVKVFFTR